MSGRDTKLKDFGLTGPRLFSSRDLSPACCLSGVRGGNWPGKHGLGYVGGGGGLRRTEVGGGGAGAGGAGGNGNPSRQLMASAADAADAA